MKLVGQVEQEIELKNKFIKKNLIQFLQEKNQIILFWTTEKELRRAM